MSRIYKYHNIPVPSDPPDVVQDLTDLVDTMWGRTSGVAWEVDGQSQVSADGSNHEIVGIDQNFAAGSLLLVSTAFIVGSLGPVAGVHYIAQNNVQVPNCPVFHIQGTPQNHTLVNQVMFVSGGPSHVECRVWMDTSSITVVARKINVQALLRG